MKKLLVATSALVAAGSAAALEVTLGGEVEAVVKYEKTLVTERASGYLVGVWILPVTPWVGPMAVV